MLSIIILSLGSFLFSRRRGFIDTANVWWSRKGTRGDDEILFWEETFFFVFCFFIFFVSKFYQITFLSVIEEIYYIPSVIIKCSHRVLVLLQPSRFKKWWKIPFDDVHYTKES